MFHGVEKVFLVLWPHVPYLPDFYLVQSFHDICLTVLYAVLSSK